MATVLERPKAPTPIKAATAPPAGTIHWLNECIERGKREVFSEATTLNPGLAAELLKRNPDNRNIRQTKVLQYETDMRAGRWEFNGEPVIISKEGLINDGQHRLRALVEANVTLPMLFVFGVEREARLTVDQGAARSAADYLGMEGVENSAIAAGVARLVIAIERERHARLYRESSVTNIEIRRRAHKDGKIAEAARYAAGTYKYTRAFAPPAVIGAAFYLLSEVHPEDAKRFMDHVCIGEELRRDDPAYAVRDALLSLGRGQKGPKLEAIFRGWVKFRAGETLRLAKVLGHFPELD
jgi:hypothetical protein